jgi:hypothetical protein
MSRQPIILKFSIENATQQTIVEFNDILKKDDVRNMIDGFDLIIFPIPGVSTDLELIYPFYKGDDEILKIQSENIKFLNKYLYDKLNPKENISIIKKIFRKIKLGRILE